MTNGNRAAVNKSGLHIVGRSLANGTKRWHVYAWRGGPVIGTRDGGPKPAITPELMDAAAKARVEFKTPTRATLGALIQTYKADRAFLKLSDPSRVDYRRSLGRIDDKFGNIALAAFEDRRMRGDIIEWRDQWSHQPRTADKLTSMLSTLLKWAVERGRIGVNVAANIDGLHSVNRAHKIWRAADWLQLEKAQTGPKDKRRPAASIHLMNALRLASITGLRLSDLVAVSWDNVGDRAIILTTQKRKSRAVIPIFPELRTLLAQLAEQYGRTGTLIKNSRGKSWTTTGLESVFQKAKIAAGLDLTIHDLRGTYVTWLASKGLTDQEIARIVGWTTADIATVREIYVDEENTIISLIDRLSA